jgi:hypothetical protein
MTFVTFWGKYYCARFTFQEDIANKYVSYLLEPCRVDFHCLGTGMDPYPRRTLRLQVYSLLQSL